MTLIQKRPRSLSQSGDADIESEPVAESLQQDVVSEDVREPSQLRRLSMGLIRLTLSTLILTSTFRMNLKPNANSCYRTLLGGMNN